MVDCVPHRQDVDTDNYSLNRGELPAIASIQFEERIRWDIITEPQ